MDVWKVALSLGFDFGDFNDWTDQASKPGSPNRQHFDKYGASLEAVKAGEQAFWAWARASWDQPGFDAGMRRWDLKLKVLERRSLRALEDLLRAYRQDVEQDVAQEPGKPRTKA